VVYASERFTENWSNIRKCYRWNASVWRKQWLWRRNIAYRSVPGTVHMLHEPKTYPSSNECHFVTYNSKQATQLTSWNRIPLQRLTVSHILWNSKGHYYVQWSLFWVKHATAPSLGRNVSLIPILAEICHWFLSEPKYATDPYPERDECNLHPHTLFH
jgi:hypothetical protein